MSMCRCDDCSALVDSDDDPECLIEIGNERRLSKIICLCERCREDREAELEAEQARDKS